MICALMIGRAGSRGFPEKNIKKIYGKFLCEYPLMASKKSKYISRIFVSTDCPKIKKISKRYGAYIIDRPKKLSDNKYSIQDVINNKQIDYAADRNPEKWGKKTVGSRIPIISEEQARLEKPDYFLILPWYFIEEFVKRENERPLLLLKNFQT